MQLETQKLRGEGFVFYRRAANCLCLADHEHIYHGIYLHLRGPVACEIQSSSRGRKVLIPSGAISIYPAGTRHAVAFQGSVEQLVLSIAPQANESFRLRERDVVSDSRLEYLMRAMYATLEDTSCDRSVCADSLLNAIVTCLRQRYSDPVPRAVAGTFGLPPARLNRVLTTIEDKLADDVSLPQLAGVAGMSLYHFAKLFKKSTGLSPYQYVINRRIEIAKTLLRNQAMSVLEVSARTGFVDQRHFAKLFRQKIGATPTAYRAALS